MRLKYLDIMMLDIYSVLGFELFRCIPVMTVAQPVTDVYLVVGVSSVHLLDDMTMMSSGNDSELKIWKLSTARAPGKTLVWASPTHTAVLKGNYPKY